MSRKAASKLTSRARNPSDPAGTATQPLDDFGVYTHGGATFHRRPAYTEVALGPE